MDKLLLDNDIKLLQGNGNIFQDAMRKYVMEEYDKFETRRKKDDIVAANKKDLEDLEEEAKSIKK